MGVAVVVFGRFVKFAIAKQRQSTAVLLWHDDFIPVVFENRHGRFANEWFVIVGAATVEIDHFFV